MKLLVATALVLSLLLATLARIVLSIRGMASGLLGGTQVPHDWDGDV